MCDPVTATGLALSAGGTFLQQREATKNQNRIQAAKDAELAAEFTRQRVHADEAGAAFNHNISKQGKDNFDEQKSLDETKIKQAFAERRTQPDYNVGLTANAPKNVVLARKAAADEAAAETDRDVANNAALHSYGGAMFNQGLDQSQFARLFGNTADKAGADARLFPIRVNAATNNASKAPSLFPTLLKLAGSGMSMYGAGSGTGSFMDKQAFGPLKPGQTWQDMTTPGLITNAKNAFGNLSRGF